jgi:hypothetical protein
MCGEVKRPVQRLHIKIELNSMTSKKILEIMELHSSLYSFETARKKYEYYGPTLKP